METAEPVTVEELLRLRKVADAAYVTVEVNDEVIDRKDFSVKTVKDGDRVEFLYYMGGGR
ncbi:MAG: hypothetical protein Kow0069_30270 [Promethearchaeota archaeon]